MSVWFFFHNFNIEDYQYPKGSEWQRGLLEATFRFSSTSAIIYGFYLLTRKILTDFPQVWVLFAKLVV